MSDWTTMDAQPRRLAGTISAEAHIPDRPGVYALYRDGARLYVGKADRLCSRLWRNHLRKSASMTNSALRRNVAEHLGIATAADIKARRYAPSAVDAKRVSDFIAACEVAWIETATSADALALEARLKREHQPPLTKR
jgi:excinuclease UvrABC nuclease subunit